MESEKDIIERISRGELKLRDVPRDRRTEAVCLAAVRRRGEELKYVPESVRSKRMCLSACRRAPSMLACVPEAVLTEAFCRNLVRTHGDALEFVPERLRTESVCLAAMEHSRAAWPFVPDAVKTEQMALLLAGDRTAGFDMASVPERFRTQALAERLVAARGGGAFLMLPADLQTADLAVKAASGADRDIWEMLPSRLEPELPAAIARLRIPLAGIPPKFIGREAAEVCPFPPAGAAGCSAEDVWRSLPAEARTEQAAVNMFRAAGGLVFHGDVLGGMDRKGAALAAMKDGFRDFYAANREILAWEQLELFRVLPEEDRTEEFCKAFVSLPGGIPQKSAPPRAKLFFVPDGMKTEAVCMAAVKADPESLKDVPDRIKTPAMCAIAVRQSGRMLRYVPGDMQTAEICLDAVRQSGLALRWAAEGLKTKKLCGEAAAHAAPERLALLLSAVPHAVQTEKLVCRAIEGLEPGMEFPFESLAPSFFRSDGRTLRPKHERLLLAVARVLPEEMAPGGRFPRDALNEEFLLKCAASGCRLGEIAEHAFGYVPHSGRDFPPELTERVQLAFHAACEAAPGRLKDRFLPPEAKSGESVPDSVVLLHALQDLAWADEDLRGRLSGMARELFPQAYSDAGLAPLPEGREDMRP